MEQFNNMCRNGETLKRFGRNNCQAWRIKYGDPNVVHVTKTSTYNEWRFNG